MAGDKMDFKSIDDLHKGDTLFKWNLANKVNKDAVHKKACNGMTSREIKRALKRHKAKKRLALDL